MVFWYLLILIVAFVKVRVCKKGFFPDYIGMEQSNAVKGLFILLVFMGHILALIKRCGFNFEQPMDYAAKFFYSEMGQLVVALFLFYSGFGVMKSLQIKGQTYLDSYPKSRLLTTLLNFDIAVCFFLLLGLLTKQPMGVSNILLSFIGWESLGNSNWYIFVILVCYLVFYGVFKAVQSYHLVGALLVTILLFGLMLVLHQVKTNQYWYNTVLVFPAGVFYALFSNQIEQVVQKRYWLVLAILLTAFVVLHTCHFRPLHGLTFNIQAIVFAIFVVILTMKIRLCNKLLVWCGLSLFPLYIYQRLPMNAIRSWAGDAWICANPNLYIAICLALTLGIALLYNKYLRIKLT